VTKPLELLGGRHVGDPARVTFNSEDMKTHAISGKLQLYKAQPLRTQIVIEAMPDIMVQTIQGGGGRKGLKPEIMAYLRFGVENDTEALKFVKLALADYLVIALNGRMQSIEYLMLEIDRIAKEIKESTAYAAQECLKRISEAREGLVVAQE
jgi:hypothetical protein